MIRFFFAKRMLFDQLSGIWSTSQVISWFLGCLVETDHSRGGGQRCWFICQTKEHYNRDIHIYIYIYIIDMCMRNICLYIYYMHTTAIHMHINYISMYNYVCMLICMCVCVHDRHVYVCDIRIHSHQHNDRDRLSTVKCMYRWDVMIFTPLVNGVWMVYILYIYYIINGICTP